MEDGVLIYLPGLRLWKKHCLAKNKNKIDTSGLKQTHHGGNATLPSL